MARNEIFVAAPPEQVFAVLGDPGAYGDWVVGAREIRDADRDWPRPGSAFHHTVGTGPLTLRDSTRVIDAEAPVMLQLRARARPLPSATVTLWLAPEGDGTRVTMIERPAQPLLSLLMGPLGHLALALRNRVSLQRLKELSEGRPRPRQPVDG